MSPCFRAILKISLCEVWAPQPWLGSGPLRGDQTYWLLLPPSSGQKNDAPQLFKRKVCFSLPASSSLFRVVSLLFLTCQS